MVAPWDADHPPRPTFNKAGFYGPQILFSILTYLTVILRLWSRRLQKARIGGTDYWIIAALIFRLVAEIESYVGVRNDGGEDYYYVNYNDPSGNRALLLVKLLMSGAVAYFWSLASSKFSLLLLYRSIFPTNSMKMASSILALTILILTIGNSFITIFSCGRPPNGWLPSILGAPGCIRAETIFLFAGIMNIFTDVACLGLPVYETLKLQLNRRNKTTVIAVFMLGGINIIVSIPRLAIVSEIGSRDPGPIMADAGLWSCIEMGIAIISVCLPVMRPVLWKMVAWFESTRRTGICEKWMPPVGQGALQSEKDIEFKAADVYYASKRHLSRSITPVPSWPSSGIVVEQSFELKSLHTSKSVKHPNNKSARQSAGDMPVPEMPALRPHLDGVERHSEAVRLDSPRKAYTSNRRLSDDDEESNYTGRSGSHGSMENKAWIHIMLS